MESKSSITQTHDERELIAAEEIINFSRSPRHHINGSIHIQIPPAPEATTSTAAQYVAESQSTTSASSTIYYLPENAFSTSTSSTIGIDCLLTVARAAEIGMSGAGPNESACYVSPPFNRIEAIVPDRGAEVPRNQEFPIRFQPFRPNLTPVANSLLQAIAARKDKEASPSANLLPSLNRSEIDAIHLRGRKEMRDFIVQSRKSMRETEISSSSSSNEEFPPINPIPEIEEQPSHTDDYTQAFVDEDSYHDRPNIQDCSVVDFVPHYQNEVTIGDVDEKSTSGGETSDETDMEVNEDPSSQDSYANQTLSSSEDNDSEYKSTNAPRDVLTVKSSRLTNGQKIKLSKAIKGMSYKINRGELRLKSVLKKKGRMSHRSIHS